MICKRLEDCINETISGRGIPFCENEVERCRASADNRSFITCAERGRKYTLHNTLENMVILYKVDGGLIVLYKSVPEGTCKCDYMIVVKEALSSVILVELKGTDVHHAIKQLSETLRRYREVLSNFEHVFVRIVATSCTPALLTSPDYLSLARVVRGEFGGNIKLQTREYKEKDTELQKAGA